MPFSCRRSTKRAEVVGRAEARRRREVPGHLVAPRAGERVLHDRHQLDVREAEVGRRSRRQLVRELEVVERAVVLERVAPPRAEMHLVDRHRLAQRVALRAPLEPLRRPTTRASSGARSTRSPAAPRRANATGSALMRSRPSCVRISNLYFAPSATPGTKSSQMPGRAERAHRMQAAVPRVEVADDRRPSARSAPTRRTRCRRRRRSRARARRASRTAARAVPPAADAGRGRRASAGTRTGRARVNVCRPRTRPRARTRAAASPSAAAPPTGPAGSFSSASTPGGLHAHRARLRPVRAHDDAAVRPRARRGSPCGSAPSSIMVSPPPARSAAGSRRPGCRPSRGGCRARSGARTPPSRARRR